ncbi:Putative glutamate--cysteine ligase 2 [Nocardiopsis dassonvillei]
MGIAFNSSERATIGVEWELQLVDRRSRHLRQEAPKLLAELPELSSDSAPPLRHELMQSQVEVVTGICETVEEAKGDLGRNIDRMREVLAPWGTTLTCSGTHPIDDWRDQELSPGERYGELVEQMQWLVRRILTCGVHVHVGVRDRDKAIPMVNALSRYLPHFLALSASSPFWGGQDTGLASSRSVIFGTLPTAGAAAEPSALGRFRGIPRNASPGRYHRLYQGSVVGHPSAP